MCDTSENAAHYHILGLKVGSFISDPPLGWLKDKEFRLYSHTPFILFSRVVVFFKRRYLN
jgi:hypothetical protein